MVEALITGAVAIVVCMINNAYQRKESELKHEDQRKETEAKYDETVAIIKYQLEQLAKRVELHNNAVERLYIVEKEQAVMENSLKSAHHRLDNLKEKIED